GLTPRRSPLARLLNKRRRFDFPLRLGFGARQLDRSRVFEILQRDDVLARAHFLLAVSLDVVALEVIHQRPDAEVAHLVRVLEDQAVHFTVADRLQERFAGIETHQVDALLQAEAAQLGGVAQQLGAGLSRWLREDARIDLAGADGFAESVARLRI